VENLWMTVGIFGEFVWNTDAVFALKSPHTRRHGQLWHGHPLDKPEASFGRVSIGSQTRVAIGLQ